MTAPEVLEAAADPVRLIVDFIEWVDEFTGTLPEAQSDRLFALYARARSFYLAVDPAAHDAHRAAVLRQAALRQAARQSRGGEG